ncbi:MAG: peroxiredoxin family protein, partial [Steroidobacteraceae bacterium]
QNLETIREDAGTFVDIVKFAMRGLRAPTVASFGEGNPLGGQQPQCSAVPRVVRARRLVFAGVLVSAGLAAGAVALAAAAYSLLGREAPDFGLHAVAGSNVRLSEYRGEVVVLSFWGSHCAPCRTQLDALDRSLHTYQSAGLRVFGINVDDDQTRALEFSKGRSVGFPLLLDPEKSVSRNYQVDNLPMTVLVDRSGIVRHVHRDYSGKEDALYLRQLRALLNE